MLRQDGNGSGTEIIFDDLSVGERRFETNEKGVPVDLVQILEYTRIRLQEIQSEVDFSGNNHERLVVAVNKKFGVILTLPSEVSNMLYRMNDGKIKNIISRVIARYAERVEEMEMIGTLEEKRDFFLDHNGFGFEIDKLIAILKDS